MKNLLLFIATIFVLFSCSNSQEKLESDSESFLKTKLKDPKSYEKISFEIVDTVRVSDIIKETEELDKYIATINLPTQSDSISNLLNSKVKSDTPKVKTDTPKVKNGWEDVKDKDSIVKINVKIKYRAKNSFGALDINESNISYFPLGRLFHDSKEKIYFDMSNPKF